ncbi:hypothetical protein HDU93_008122 [Gonapodya sp. JEL0774]|nr:hypothetical protein HDU93_008122 [Gonapodya sp. JEL0774]
MTFAASTLIDAIAGGAGALAYKKYEERREAEGLPPAHHQGAKEVLAGIVSFEVAKHLQSYEAVHGPQQKEKIAELEAALTTASSSHSTCPTITASSGPLFSSTKFSLSPVWPHVSHDLWSHCTHSHPELTHLHACNTFTGGGTGIGRTIAHELASLSATVVVASRKRENLDTVQKEITGLGGKCDVITVNIRDPDSCRACVKWVLDKHGRIDGLVNNGGGQFSSPASTISHGGFRTVVDLNLFGTWNMTRAVYDLHFKHHGSGKSIVNVLMNHSNGYHNMAHSAAARAGVENLTKTLALVRWVAQTRPATMSMVNCEFLGTGMDTRMWGTIMGSGMKNYPPHILEMAIGSAKYTHSGRYGTEAEVSACVVFLLSPASSYVNGHVIQCSGGGQYLPGGVQDTTHEMVGFGESKVPIFMGFDIDPDTLDAPKSFQEAFRDLLRIADGGKKQGERAKI